MPNSTATADQPKTSPDAGPVLSRSSTTCALDESLRDFSRPPKTTDTIRTGYMFTPAILSITLAGIGFLALLAGFKVLTGAVNAEATVRIAGAYAVLLAIAGAGAIVIGG